MHLAFEGLDMRVLIEQFLQCTAAAAPVEPPRRTGQLHVLREDVWKC